MSQTKYINKAMSRKRSLSPSLTVICCFLASALSLKRLFRAAACLVLIFAAGCSNSNSAATFDPDAGRHPANWSSPVVHGPAAKASPGAGGLISCQSCHGTDFAGGISRVDCFACHGINAPHPAAWLSGDPFTHENTAAGNAFACAPCHTNGANSPTPPPPAPPAGTPPGCFNSTLCHGETVVPASHANPNWGNPAVHGADAKAAPDPTRGFASCSLCHGSDFATVLAGLSCAICHGVAAPHPAAWLSGNLFTHTDTDPGNAPVCFSCHAGGANSPIDPPPEPPAGTPPGCFNNTLCHGILSPHPAGWGSPEVHGPVAKAAPAAAAGFNSCQACHAADFSGGTSGLACSVCHVVNAPHPDFWMPGPADPLAHTNTNTGNAPVCFLCHAGGANSPIDPPPPPPVGTPPGCSNNTLCHGAVAPDARHDQNWTVNHSNAARGLSLAVLQTDCGVCHGGNFTGNIGPSCFLCHLDGPLSGAGVMHPDRWTNPEVQHPPFLRAIGNDAVSCSPVSPRGFNVARFCHGENLLQTSPRAAPPNGSWVQAPSCFICHGKVWILP